MPPNNAHETTPSDAAIGQAFREQYQVPRGEHGAVRAYVNQVFERAREIEQGRGALPELPEPPVLPDSLLSLIGKYGEAISRRASEVDRIWQWERLLNGIKGYARAYGEACRRMGSRDE